MNFDNYDMVLVGIGEEFENNDRALESYNRLAEKLEGKNYFCVSLCMDDVIYKSNLKHDRIVAPLGTGLKKQCPDACDNLLYENGENVCSVCGKPLVDNNILCEKYIEDGYLPMWDKQKKWLVGTLNHSVLVLELGVSMRFPQIVRWPFERIAYLNNKAYFTRVNEKLPQLSAELKEKGESIKANSVEWLLVD